VRLPDDAWLLLHDVRLRGFVADEGASSATLIEAGFVVRAPRGLRITSEGRTAHASWARIDVGSDPEASVRRAYERFLPLNRELIRICNDWQVRPGGVANDHRDLRYDWSVLERVRAVDERIAPIARRVARDVERFAVYQPRLRTALVRVDEGDHEWLTSPRIDSYHTVWMQMHEDLLLALGLDRANEGNE
jgi:hypothetical protein